MNRVDLTGRITKDPEVKVTQSGVSVCGFYIASRRSYKNSKGEYDVDYIRCVAYGAKADFMKKYIHQGDLIGVGGAVRQYKYEKDGEQHTGLEVVIGSSGNVEKLAAKQNAAKNDGLDGIEPMDEDIPF